MGATAWKRMFNTTILIALTAGICISLVQFRLNTDGSAVSAQPHEVPIAVVGSPVAVRQLSPELERGDAFKVEEASNEAAALRMVNDRTSDGIINLNTHVVQTAKAASYQQPVSFKGCSRHGQTSECTKSSLYRRMMPTASDFCFSPLRLVWADFPLGSHSLSWGAADDQRQWPTRGATHSWSLRTAEYWPLRSRRYQSPCSATTEANFGPFGGGDAPHGRPAMTKRASASVL